MVDPEKVIKGLYAHGYRDCKSCPYWGSGENGASICTQLTREAFALLKEKEPVKPRYTPKSIYSWECGVCAEPFDRIANYCPNCGRQVKWE